MSQQELSEQEIQRRESLNKLRSLNIEPFPAPLYPVNALSKELLENYEEGKEVCVAGRMMSRRIMGKASFAELQDSEGRIQVYVNRDEICPKEDKSLYNDVFKKLLTTDEAKMKLLNVEFPWDPDYLSQRDSDRSHQKWLIKQLPR